MEYRNPKYNSNGTIDCEINHPQHGWIPFTANPEDTGAEFDVAALVTEMVESDTVLPYEAPDPEEALAHYRASLTPLSFSQLLIGLVSEQWITEAEGEAWLEGNGLPAAVSTVISQLPPEERFTAKARALRMSVANRLDPLVAELSQAGGKTPEDVDLFWETYSQI
jgi:hypothetical protein